MDKLSYAWGLAMGRQLQGMGMKELNVVDFKDGVRSVFDGSEPAIGVEEAQKLIQDYLNDLQAKAEETAKAAGKKFPDGTVSDSSVNRGEPATFPLNRVIPGWTEGVQLMKEGAKYTFFIPSDLAYGPQGIPGAIPAHSTLIFDVELIKVIKK